MNIESELQRVSELLDDDKAKDALQALDRLEKRHPGHPDVLWHRVLVLQSMDKNAQARSVAEGLVTQRGMSADFWQTCSYLRGDDHASALADLERGLALLPGHVDLLRSKALVLRSLQREQEARAVYDALVAGHPGDADMHLARADFLELCAWDVADDADVVTDAMGVQYSRRDLQAALADHGAAVALRPQDHRLRVKRAKCLRRLGREDEAVADYDAALALLPPDSPLREFLLEQRKSERDQMGELLERVRGDMQPGKGNMTLQDQMADAMLRSVADQLKAGENFTSATEAFFSEEPDDIAATNVARNFFNMGHFPTPDLQPVQAQEFPGYMRSHCDRVQRELLAAGYRLLGDYEAVHLRATLGQRVLLRCFLSSSGRTCAAAYALRPLWPGWLNWLLLCVTGRWKTARVVDCETELADGNFVVTMNAGAMGEFEYGDAVQQNLLPLGTPVSDVLRAHAKALKALASRSVRHMASFEDLLAMQTRLQELKNRHRQNIGYATDKEMRRLLGGQYERFAGKVRAKLALMARAAPAASTAPAAQPQTTE
jgi:tetratricopeptide (TPR) repeat protein